MISRKSLSFLALATASLIVLLMTSRRLGAWSSFEEGPFYRPEKPMSNGNNHRPPHPPHGQPEPTDSLVVDTTTPPPPNASHHRHNDLPPRPDHDPLCDSFPDTTGILIVMKTGASEAYGKLPTQFLTMMRCLPDFLVFSDLEEHVAGHHVHDSLDTVLAEAKDGNSDFDLYRRQQSCLVDQAACNKLGDPATEGWNLDKYKNVHIAEKAYSMRPGYDWYVFVDADTYVLLPNLVQWLRTLDPNQKHYLGSVTLIGGFGFGHGGSGYVVSKAVMRDFVGRNPGVANKYDLRAKHECCGDFMFAMALNDTTRTRVKQVWPTINGEKPHTLPFGPSHWCQPIVTMHHMNSEEISSFWEYEHKLYATASQLPSTPPPVILIKDIFHKFFEPKLRSKIEDWNNLSDDRYYLDKNRTWESWQLERMKEESKYNEAEKRAHLSFEDCARACESLSHDECFQYKFSDGVCSMAGSFKLGGPVKKEGEEAKRSMSGWDVNKIKRWIADQADCKMVQWPEVSSEWN